MYSFEWMIGVALVALAGGLGLGALLGQSMASTRKVKSLQEELEAARDAHNDYRSEVYDQFSETARKFERLNESYRDLHQQLATSAVTLLGDTAGRPLLRGPDASDQVIDADVTSIPEVTSAPAPDASEASDDAESAPAGAAASPETPSANETELAATQPTSAAEPAASGADTAAAAPATGTEATNGAGPDAPVKAEAAAPDADTHATSGGRAAGLRA
ncbi:MAG: DUF1043 family protein [Pseudomonadota bacterium]